MNKKRNEITRHWQTSDINLMFVYNDFHCSCEHKFVIVYNSECLICVLLQDGSWLTLIYTFKWAGAFVCPESIENSPFLYSKFVSDWIDSLHWNGNARTESFHSFGWTFETGLFRLKESFPSVIYVTVLIMLIISKSII